MFHYSKRPRARVHGGVVSLAGGGTGWGIFNWPGDNLCKLKSLTTETTL